jgi:hypothetical protein
VSLTVATGCTDANVSVSSGFGILVRVLTGPVSKRSTGDTAFP